MSVAVTATSSSLSSPLLLPSSHGLIRRPCLSLQWRRTQRRRFSRKAAASGVVTAKFELKPPPYPLDGMEPHMSRETLEYHWGRHHRTYVENLNKQIAGTDLDGLSLEDVVLVSYNNGSMLPAFNNAAQAWNHEFFWESIKPGGGGKPSGELLRLIERDFGSFQEFSERFKSAAASQFGSGWTWLAYKANRLDVGNAVNPIPKEEDKKLVIVKSPNAINPLIWDFSPLLTIDVWEHAYYLDFEVTH
ncbi:PREDICTED: superoxide dismutase [Fe] 2, chloroplastic isoform X2 [Tarenaya hassleriana]|uniref:superoxide dismutase [Fe] 2, chloroplastic isoform X2 n=1 Tax=Tarenaya hassleriana TaxID=28532 RepID=UPI0008FD771C|nr:PREDICTED: superoxide dismutase [Fe] 2, chloroplastic isoform X2 [Tarenaya hassleriana]